MKYALGLALASATLTYFFGVTRALVALATLAAGLCVFVLKTTSVDVTSMFMLLLVMGLPAFVAGAGVGVAAGLAFRARSHLIGLLCFLPIILVIGSEYYVAEKQVREEKLALAFVTKNAQLQKLVGGTVEVFQVSATKYSDPDKGMYDFSIKGTTLYAIVKVSRRSGRPVFNLACVTTLYVGHRTPSLDVCEQSVVPLPRLYVARYHGVWPLACPLHIFDEKST